jgi:hypothetical protein
MMLATSTPFKTARPTAELAPFTAVC